MSKSNTKLPILFFFENHSDKTPTKFIFDNLEKLKEMGYNKILVLLPHSIDLSQIYKLTSFDIQTLEDFNSPPQTKQLTEDQTYHKTKIDTKIAKGKLYEKAKKLDFELMPIDINGQALLRPFNPIRIQHITDNITKETKRSNGGIICWSIGSLLAHPLKTNLDIAIKTLPKNNFSYLFFELYNPDIAFPPDIDIELCEALESLRKTHIDYSFPVTYRSFTEVSNKVINIISQNISSEVSLYKYERKIEEKPINCELLSIITGLEFSAYLRTGNMFFVDALVEKSKIKNDSLDILTRYNISYKFKPLEDGKEYLCIADINSREIGDKITAAHKKNWYEKNSSLKSNDRAI